MTLDEAICIMKPHLHGVYVSLDLLEPCEVLLDFAEKHKDCVLKSETSVPKSESRHYYVSYPPNPQEFCMSCCQPKPKPKIEELTLDWRIDPENETQMSKLVEYCLKLQNKVNELVRRVNQEKGGAQ